MCWNEEITQSYLIAVLVCCLVCVCVCVCVCVLSAIYHYFSGDIQIILNMYVHMYVYGPVLKVEWQQEWSCQLSNIVCKLRMYYWSTASWMVNEDSETVCWIWIVCLVCITSPNLISNDQWQVYEVAGMPCPHSNVCLPAAPAEFGILSPHIKFIMHVLFKNLTSLYVALAYCRFIVDVSSAEVAWPTVEIVPPPALAPSCKSQCHPWWRSYHFIAMMLVLYNPASWGCALADNWACWRCCCV